MVTEPGAWCRAKESILDIDHFWSGPFRRYLAMPESEPPEILLLGPAGAFCGGRRGGRRDDLLPGEHVFLGNSAEVRVAEFAAGRYYARAALAGVGVPSVELPKGSDRAPVWPPGVVGSISHCLGFCGSIAVSRRVAQSVGYDVELASPLSSELWEMVGGPREFVAACDDAPMGMAQVAKVLFSTKEAIYKAWAPITGEFLDFLDVEVTIDWSRGSFRARIVKDVNAEFSSRRTFRGTFCIVGEYVHALCFMDGQGGGNG